MAEVSLKGILVEIFRHDKVGSMLQHKSSAFNDRFGCNPQPIQSLMAEFHCSTITFGEMTVCCTDSFVPLAEICEEIVQKPSEAGVIHMGEWRDILISCLSGFSQIPWIHNVEPAIDQTDEFHSCMHVIPILQFQSFRNCPTHDLRRQIHLHDGEWCQIYMSWSQLRTQSVCAHTMVFEEPLDVTPTDCALIPQMSRLFMSIWIRQTVAYCHQKMGWVWNKINMVILVDRVVGLLRFFVTVLVMHGEEFPVGRCSVTADENYFQLRNNLDEFDGLPDDWEQVPWCNPFCCEGSQWVL